MEIDKIKAVESKCTEAHGYYYSIIDEYSKDLDALVNNIETEIITDKNYSNLQQFALELPIALYNLSSTIEALGLKVDFAGIVKDEKYSRLLINANGTIPEKQARATVFSNSESYAKEIFERCYYALKTKINYAEQLLISIRALLTSLEKEMQYA